MRYFGGKFAIARPLAAAILARAGRRRIWEPFVGGANMTEHLRPEIASDKHAALIAMYRALYAGWDPPSEVSRDEYRAARDLADTDPQKAFAGFACSFGGRWFKGYTSPGIRLRRGDAKPSADQPAAAARAALVRLRDNAPNTRFEHADFLTVPPRKSTQWCVYADPPYAGVTGYGDDFDHAAFWQRCQQWARFGALVLVSEYTCPVPHRAIFECTRKVQLLRSDPRTERLFEVLPAANDNGQPWRGDR